VFDAEGCIVLLGEDLAVVVLDELEQHKFSK